jgi:hypothetical protein
MRWGPDWATYLARGTALGQACIPPGALFILDVDIQNAVPVVGNDVSLGIP